MYLKNMWNILKYKFLKKDSTRHFKNSSIEYRYYLSFI